LKTLRLTMTLVLFSLAATGIGLGADAFEVGPLEAVKAIPMRPEWDRFKILVWQYRTSVLKDIGLYRKLGLGGFHIDRGYGKDELVGFSNKAHFPYYVDHAADKGFLYLRGKDVEAVTGKRGLVVRPHSLADPMTIREIETHLSRNIKTTMKGMVLAYAFDDEIWLGRFVSPSDEWDVGTVWTMLNKHRFSR
jgi:hypothetical protein